MNLLKWFQKKVNEYLNLEQDGTLHAARERPEHSADNGRPIRYRIKRENHVRGL